MIEKFTVKPEAKLKRLSNILEQAYNVSIDWSQDQADLRLAFNHYSEKRISMIQANGYSEINNNKEYAKAVLISESIKIWLNEIAPKRTKKKLRGNRD